MPILDQPDGADFDKAKEAADARYIFCGRDILLLGGTLPGRDFYSAFVAEQKRAKNLDLEIAEIPQNYAAAKIARLSDERANPAGENCPPPPRVSGNKKAPSDSGGIEKSKGADTTQKADFVPLREFCADNPKLAPLALRAKGILFWRDTYRHCPKCGGAFCNDKKETALVCPACSFKLYPRIEPAVIVLIRRGDKILLARNKHSGAKFYSCIAGFVELGESAVEAVKRETKEEVGLELKNVQEAGTQSWPYPDQLMLAYTAEWAGGELVLQEDEIAEARWFSMDALPPPEQMPGRGSAAWNLIQSALKK